MLGAKWVKFADKYGQWVLLLVILLYVISGYGMTKRFMDPAFARTLHSRILPIPLFLFFLTHILIPVNHQFRKWRIFQSVIAIDLFTWILFLAVAFLFFWLFLA